MTTDIEFQKKIMQILSWMSAVITSQRLYLSHNPYIAENTEKAYRELLALMPPDTAVTLFLVGEDVVVNRSRLTSVSPAAEKFTRILKQRKIESLSFLPELQKDEFRQFLRDLASPDLLSIASRNCIKLGKVELRKKESDNLSQDSDSNDPGAADHPSDEQLIREPVSLTGREPRELEEQYKMVHLEKKIDIHSVDQIVIRFINELERNLCPIYLLGSVKSFHEYTYTHLINVGILTMSLAAELGFAGNQLHEIGIAALLHDVGKTFIPDEILSKAGMLSPEERTIIEAHPVKGCLYLMEVAEMPGIAILSALEHHLKFDGTGYPVIRQGWKPNIVAQMITIADVFDALRSRRSYKEPKPLPAIEEILHKEKGTTFNPDLVDVFLQMITPKDSQQKNTVIQNVEKRENEIVGDNLKPEQDSAPQTDETNQDAAVADLYRRIVIHAKAKNFVAAESLREKLMDMDPMALTEIITSAEIIEQEKKEGMTHVHSTVWADLYQSFIKEEGNALYYAMKEAAYSNGQAVFTPGDRNSNLYFVNQGRLKMLCSHDGKEILVKTLAPSDIFGIDTFFSDSVCTTQVIAFPMAKVSYIEKKVLQEWKEKFPALETKLNGYCLKFEKTQDLLRKKNLDRRMQRRFRIEGKAVVQILGASGAPVGKPFGGVLADISATGVACIVKLIKKEIGQLLLGRSVELKLSFAFKGANRAIDQVGTIVAVSSPPFDDYYLHVRFHQMLDGGLVRELAAR